MRTLPHHTLIIAALGLALLPTIASAEKDPYAGKKLIQYGFDAPHPEFLRQNVRRMEQEAAFDGVVIPLVPKDQPRSISGLGTRAFSKVRFKPEEYEWAIEKLNAIPFERFTDNFIQMQVTPADVDWFDPKWSTVAYNAACLARVAKQGDCKGLTFDPEDYTNSSVWCYGGMPEERRAVHSAEAYVAKVKERGKEFIRAINKEYPDITILALFGPSLSYGWYEVGGLRAGSYGLLYAFYDGICEAAAPGTTLHDGYEQSYSFRERSLFQDGRKTMLELTKDILSTNPKSYAEHVRAGFGIWCDLNSYAYGGWHTEDLSKNYYTPEQFRRTLAYALEASDKYVWIWGEQVKWWDFEVPEPYRDALSLAKSGTGPDN